MAADNLKKFPFLRNICRDYDTIRLFIMCGFVLGTLLSNSLRMCFLNKLKTSIQIIQWNRDRGLKMKISGSLEKDKPADLLRMIRREFITGVLSLRSRDGLGTIYSNNGDITWASTPTSVEGFERILIEENIISRVELKNIAVHQKGEDRYQRIRKILLKKNLITEKRLVEIIVGNIKDTVYAMVFWDGIYQIEETDKIEHNFDIRIDIEGLLDDLNKSFFQLEEDFTIDGKEASSRERGEESSNIEPGQDEFLPIGEEEDWYSELSDTKSEIIKSIDKITAGISSMSPQEIVVLVDDEKLMRTIFSESLTDFGYQVNSFDNPGDALEMINDLETSLVSVVLIIDLIMPGLSSPLELYGGLELLSEINHNYPHIPVIVSTSVADYKMKLKSLFYGASYFVNKPKQGNLADKLPGVTTEEFTQELALCVENLFRNRRTHHQKEQLAMIRKRLINELIDAKFAIGIEGKKEIGEGGIKGENTDLALLKKYARDLLKNQNFSHIVDTILDFLAIDHDRGFIALTRKGEMRYYRGFTNMGDDKIPVFNEVPERFVIDFLTLKPIQEVVTSQSTFNGEMDSEDARLFHQYIGGYVPKKCLIIPFTAFNKTVALLYLDERAEKITGSNIDNPDQVQVLCLAGSLAMQITILNEKIGRIKNRA